MRNNKAILNKVTNSVGRNITKINLILLATSLITLNPLAIGIGTFGVAVSKLSEYDTFIKFKENKVKKIDKVIDSLNSLPEKERDDEVEETISKLLETKALHEKEIIRLKGLKSELYKESLNKKAKKLSKPVIKKKENKK